MRGDVMTDPTYYSINDVLEDLNYALDEDNPDEGGNEQLTELEFAELMEALDRPGL
jgi:hypothetical protein